MTVEQVTLDWLEKLKKSMNEIHLWHRYETKRVKRSKKIQKPEPVKVTPVKVEKEKTTLQQYAIHEKKSGYVYLMRSGNGYYKIGLSRNVKNRLNGLKRQFPIQIEVIHQIACHDHRKVERFLHGLYSAKRVEYEWFALDKKDVQRIKSLKDYELG